MSGKSFINSPETPGFILLTLPDNGSGPTMVPLDDINQLGSPYLAAILDAAEEEMLLLETTREYVFKCEFLLQNSHTFWSTSFPSPPESAIVLSWDQKVLIGLQYPPPILDPKPPQRDSHAQVRGGGEGLGQGKTSGVEVVPGGLDEVVGEKTLAPAGKLVEHQQRAYNGHGGTPLMGVGHLQVSTPFLGIPPFLPPPSP
jgi:hypothetical protein